MVTPSEVPKDIDSVKLSEFLEIDLPFYSEQMRRCKLKSPYRESPFVKQVSVENYNRFLEHIHKFKGFYGQSRSIRSYPYKSGALVLGDIGEIDSSQIKANQDYTYLSGDYIGKNGIELSYEKYLRGIRGVRTVIVDAFNRIKGSYSNGEFDSKSEAGDDLVSSLDIDLQVLGETLLTQKSGSIVAIEPNTGEILALCSGPTYDPNILKGKIRGENYAKLVRNKNKPLLNRAIQGVYPPGSIFKAAVALVALQMRAIDINFTYYCPGYYPIGAKRLKCSHGHPACKNVMEALMHSCNPYFCQTFRNSIDVDNAKSIALDYSKWYKNMMRFGLNQKLGLDIKNEKKGNLPDTGFYNRMYRNSWKPTTIISLGIGQGEVLMTPLQMANTYATIANRGYYIVPHLVKNIVKDGVKYKNPSIKKVMVPIEQSKYNAVIDGLERVVVSGTARSSKIEGISLCGKTGTAQNPHGNDHSIFVGFAPKDNPKIVVACVVENAGSGGGTAGPIVSLICEKYIKKKLSPAREATFQMIKNRHIIKFNLDEDIVDSQ
jgi:penicillin-binding protein 2